MQLTAEHSAAAWPHTNQNNRLHSLLGPCRKLHPACRIPRRQPLRVLLISLPFACRSSNDLGIEGGTAVARALGQLTALTALGLG